MTVTYGKKIPFGLTVPLPLVGFPEGKARIRIRQDEFARVFIKTESETIGFYPTESDGAWVPGYESGRNKKQDT